MLTVSMILNGLGAHVLFADPCCPRSQEYQGAYLLDGTSFGESGAIYLGTCQMVQDLLALRPLPAPCILFTAGDSQQLRELPRPGISLITTDLTLPELHNCLLKTAIQCRQWERQLLENAKNGLHALLYMAATELHLSITLMTPGLSPSIYYERNGQPPRISTSLQSLLKQLDQGADAPVTALDPSNGHLLAFMPLGGYPTVLGYLYVCGRTTPETLKNMLELLAPIAARLLLADKSPKTDAYSFQTLATQFLGEHPDNLDKLELKLRQIPNKPRRFMRGTIIRQIDDDGQITPVSSREFYQLFLEIQRMFPLDHAAILDECIYLMTSDELPDAPITITENSAFCALLEQYHAYAMVSNPSQRLQGVRVLFRQCFQILPVAVSLKVPDASGQRCLRFDRYSPYYIIHLCEQSSRNEMGDSDILYLCHPAILTLTRYDSAYNSNLRDTLFTFLMNDRNISETSRKMFMHRNTTIYKLNKIQELIHDDLENPYTRHQLILSCMIIAYVERHQHTTFQLPPLDSKLLRK